MAEGSSLVRLPDLLSLLAVVEHGRDFAWCRVDPPVRRMLGADAGAALLSEVAQPLRAALRRVCLAAVQRRWAAVCAFKDARDGACRTWTICAVPVVTQGVPVQEIRLFALGDAATDEPEASTQPPRCLRPAGEPIPPRLAGDLRTAIIAFAAEQG